MFYNHNKKLVNNAQSLRKNITREEKHLWYDFLKKLPLTVNRQKNIGNYIVDFLISIKMIIIEIDGVQHTLPENEEADIKRDKELQKLEFKILRYTNKDINQNFNAVCDDILKNIGISVSYLNL